MKLSPHFTLEELTRTSYARLQDEPSLQVVANLTYLCALVLEPFREKLGKPVAINSGYRSKAVNAAVGGVSDSYHLRGLAADIRCSGLSDGREKLALLKDIEKVDLAMLERKGRSVWVHVQTSHTPRRRVI